MLAQNREHLVVALVIQVPGALTCCDGVDTRAGHSFEKPLAWPLLRLACLVAYAFSQYDQHCIGWCVDVPVSLVEFAVFFGFCYPPGNVADTALEELMFGIAVVMLREHYGQADHEGEGSVNVTAVAVVPR